jgi:hypothetical protein
MKIECMHALRGIDGENALFFVRFPFHALRLYYQLLLQ